jgi:hypothetical protein
MSTTDVRTDRRRQRYCERQEHVDMELEGVVIPISVLL